MAAVLLINNGGAWLMRRQSRVVKYCNVIYWYEVYGISLIRHVASRRVAWRGVASRRIASRQSRRVASRGVTSRHVTSRQVTTRHVTSRHVTSRHATPRHATSPGNNTYWYHWGNGCINYTSKHVSQSDTIAGIQLAVISETILILVCNPQQ